MAYKNFSSDKLEIGQIILGYTKRILDIASHELKASERILLLENQREVVESEDTRMSYIQAIENFAYCLLPYFDKKMKDAYDKEIVFLQGFGYEIIKKIDDEEFKKRLEGKEGDAKRDLLISMQIKHAKLLFIELNLLLKRVDYLKSSVFGDVTGDDEIEVDD